MNGFNPNVAALAATIVIAFAAVCWLIGTRRDRKGMRL